jgi:hypothetical protein
MRAAIAESIPHIPMIPSDSTIDRVLDTMILTGSEQLGTLDESGVFTGILTYSEIFRFVMSAIVQEDSKEGVTKEHFSQEAEKDTLEVCKVLRDGSSFHRNFQQVLSPPSFVMSENNSISFP